MNFNANFPKRNLFRQIITLLCLLILLWLGWQWFSNRQNNDLSFLLPIYQAGEEIRPSAIISEDGQVLLPVRAIAEKNGWLCQSEQLQGEDTPLSCGSMLLLPRAANPSAEAEAAAPPALVICWLSNSAEQPGGRQPDTLGVWLPNGNQLLALSAPGRFYQDELYLPEDFFAAAFGLSLKLDENGRANLLAPGELPQNAPQA